MKKKLKILKIEIEMNIINEFKKLFIFYYK